MKKYRKIRKTDALPALPKSFVPLYYLKEKTRTLIWAEDKDKRYTIEWDRVSEYPHLIHYTSL